MSLEFQDSGWEFSAVDDSSTTAEKNEQFKSLKSVQLGAELVEILPDHVYLGNASMARSLTKLQKYKITHVVTVMDQNLAKKILQFYGKKQLFVRFHDSMHEPIENYFMSTYQWIKTINKKTKPRILIHCFMGLSRSVTLLIAFIMIGRRWSLEKTYSFVKGKRPMMRPNDGFIIQLKLLDFLLFHPFSQLTLSYL